MKKARLALFLARRIPKFGWAQALRGIRDRRVSYTAMGLAEVLPAAASTIVDVGAHTGLVADALDFLYRPRKIWAVEPNPALSLQLEERFRGRPQFSLLHSCLGESSGETSFNVYEFDAASSLFHCKPGHMAALGLSERNCSVTVPITTLEALMAGFKGIDLLVLDCQGSELSALKGAGGRISEIRWIYCEVSIDDIYVGAPLFGELHRFLRDARFELRTLCNFSGAGRSIQWADALYANTRFP